MPKQEEVRFGCKACTRWLYTVLLVQRHVKRTSGLTFLAALSKMQRYFFSVFNKFHRHTASFQALHTKTCQRRIMKIEVIEQTENLKLLGFMGVSTWQVSRKFKTSFMDTQPRGENPKSLI